VERFELIKLNLDEGLHRSVDSYLLSPSLDAARRFVLAIDEFASHVEGAVLVFQDGCWRYDEDLYEDIQNSRLDNIVLPGGMADQIRDDVQQWLGV
jgi:hypothetical protein